VLLSTVAPERVLLLPSISTPQPVLGPVVPPLRVFVFAPGNTRMPPPTAVPNPLPLTSFQLTALLLEAITTPNWLAPLARMLFSVCPPFPPTLQPIVPPTESGPTIVSFPVLVMFQTGSVGSSAVILADV